MKTNNSVMEMVAILNITPYISENHLNLLTFGYDRNDTWVSNKKYADMLRRGMTRGLIGRIENPIPGKIKFLYYPIKQK